jgi:hypothetical protein
MTNMSKNDSALESEFDAAMAKAGVVVPAARKAGTLAAYAEMKGMMALIRQPRTAAAEPSNIYTMVSYMKATKP